MVVVGTSAALLHRSKQVLLAVCTDFDRFAETVDESTDTFEQYICNIAKWEQCRRGELDRALSFVTGIHPYPCHDGGRGTQ